LRRSDHILLTSAPAQVSAGAIAKGLHDGFSVPAEAVRRLSQTPDGVILELDPFQGRRIITPCPVQLGAGRRGVLRRANDLAAPAPPWVLKVDTDAGLTAGQLAASMHSSGGVAGEDVGVIRRDAGALSVELPRWRCRQADLPKTVDGHTVSVEKKNAGRGRSAESAALALAELVDGGVPASKLARAMRQALRTAWSDPELISAARNLAAHSFEPAGQHGAADPALLTLTVALSPRTVLETRLQRLSDIAFPNPRDVALKARLGDLLQERTSALPTGHACVRLARSHGLETRVMGTFCPGLRAAGAEPVATPAVEGDDLWSAWLRIAGALLSADGLDPAELRTFDRRVRDEATHAEIPLGTWPELLALVEAEATGAAAPIRTSLAELDRTTSRYELSAVREIDEQVRVGNWNDAARLATEAIAAHPESVPLARRHVRLTGSASAAVDDDVCLVLAADAALRAGRAQVASAALMAATPPVGSPAAEQAARRLLEAGQHANAWALMSPATAASDRATAAWHTHRWAEAVAAWAESQGQALGLTEPPDWADAGVRATLPAGYGDVLDGELSAAAEALDDETLAARCTQVLSGELGPAPPPAPATPDDAAALLFETSDPAYVLSAFSRAIADADAFQHWSALLGRLVTELIANPPSARAIEALTDLSAHGAATLQGWLDEQTLIGWLEGHDPDVRNATIALARARANHSPALDEALAHTPTLRAEHAEELVAEGRMDEAEHIAVAAIRKAADPAIRRRCIKTLLDGSHTDPLITGLQPDRDPTLLYDILTTLTAAGEVPATLQEAVATLARAKTKERVRSAAAALLTQARR